MASRSPSHSEGEILSSDSEAKAKNIPSFHNNSKVDRRTRPYSSSHGPSRSHRSRSRSPYRATRGEKRPRENDHYRGRSNNDSRTFSVRYESHRDSHHRRGSYEERSAKRSRTYSFSRSRSRSRSPYRQSRPRDGEKDRSNRTADRDEPAQNETQRQSGSEMAAEHTANGPSEPSSVAPPDSATDQVDEPKPIDEAALIEERRKRREAIKNKFRGQAAPPLLVQALHMGSDSARDSPAPDTDVSTPRRSESPTASSPRTPRDTSAAPTSAPPSPAEVNFDADADLTNSRRGSPPEDGPSAADYDPTVDMEDERARHDKRLFKEDDKSLEQADPHVAEQSNQATAPTTKQATEFDMFAEEDDDDMFAEAPTKPKEEAKTAQALDVGLMDNWDDPEGYYITMLGELIEDRYHVTQNLGKGMFSTVVRATDRRTSKPVAIKIVRNNETMRKAGIKEIDILKDIAANDPEDKKHIIRLERSFDHKGHLCMVFENLSMNLREVLKKFGRDVGINLKAIRAYAQQLFLGLSLLRKCQYIHADLKPDNILVNEARNTLKICDLGSASPITENVTAPYLVSRFYRAPEVILGIPYDYGIDMWSIGCTLFELYTGKILFTGRNNNGMLRAIMECRGKFPHKLLRRGALTYEYFDDLLNFRAQETDKVTGRTVIKMIDIKAKPVRDLRSRLIPKDKRLNEQERKELESFVDLLEKCLDLRPEKRITPNDALKHPFITRIKT
ncbi:U4/U6 small nuclear ribonucleoprotein prp4 [Exophiala dermatitidis]|nr:U4/U6 small nuclear ribonucleoprotein prp4, variant 2 [Exophiala dermatitidis]KAJ4621257.1 U4/U6 small nuclear ribonucleoprotein prp4, variant 2 [Exophiala dermatitidis]KAJ4697861.1 U4/U6 small nuclear ribonucleoprotein prp4, variant 2 [Exophiala dermatitidis]KAJ8995714.1 U4/U6 small nuclear ribonucleoprotein prp4 [Exophiala dermatitidis]KAJ9004838.1 U4/U6 small nuclear ribonucleoprotein prp4 [Exophiala dermatitidis]